MLREILPEQEGINLMKKNHVTPKMEVVELKKENMILTSGCQDTPCLAFCQIKK